MARYLSKNFMKTLFGGHKSCNIFLYSDGSFAYTKNEKTSKFVEIFRAYDLLKIQVRKETLIINLKEK